MLILLLSSALVAATGLLLSSWLAEGSVTQWLIGAYVIAFAEVVVLSLLLSVGSNLRQSFLLASVTGVFCVALASADRNRVPSLRSAARTARSALRDPAVAAVSVVVAGVIVYSIALALFLPANDLDALQYHLARAAFWRQQGAIGYIADARDARLNNFSPNGEIAMAFTMITSGNGRFAPLVQLAAALATVLAVYGISRRIRLSMRGAAFGALLFLTLPVVALQASTGLNDIVVTSFVASSTFFLLGATWRNDVLGALAIALMIGAKLTGILALPVLALIAIATRRRRPRLALGMLASAAAIGTYWYWINLVRVGDAIGVSRARVHADAIAALARVIRLGLDTIELPGALGRDRLLYVGAAALLATFALVARGSARARGIQAAVAAGFILAPLAFVPLGHLLVRGSQKLFFELGRSDVGYLDSDRSPTKASPIFSWYGPLGILLTVLSCVLVARAVRRRDMPVVALVLCIAPAIWIVFVGATIPYSEWNGRYTMGGFALATATWGVALPVRPVAWAAAALAVLATTLAFVHLHDRPSGLRLLEPTAERSVWSQPSWSVQATDHPQLAALIRFVDRHVPTDARLALEPTRFPGGSNEGGTVPPFPFFGPRLSRRILFADSVKGAQDANVDWAILRDDGIGGCAPGWEEVFRSGVWMVLRHAPGSLCG